MLLTTIIIIALALTWPIWLYAFVLIASPIVDAFE